MVFQVRIGYEDHQNTQGTTSRISRKTRYNKNMTKCWKDGKDVVDDNPNYQGARMVFLIMNSIDILEDLRMLMMITTHLSRDFMRM